MRFAEPAWLLWLAGVPALGVLAWLVAVRRRRALALFAGGSAHLASFVSRVSVHRRAVKALLLLLAAAAGIAALARPQWGMRVEPISHRGVDVVLVLDTSLSMAAPDVPPDRLALARQSARALVGKLAGDRLALVTFAGRATLVCPLTPDTAAVQLFLDTVDVTSVSAPGSALAEALRAALSAFGERPAPGSERGRAVVLLSDGEDHEGGIEEVLKELAAADVAVFTVGCGT